VALQRLDAPARTDIERPRVDVQTISPSTLDVLRVPVVAGRAFLSTDSADAPRVAIVSQEAVRRFWPDRDPIGTVVTLGQDPRAIRIVAVAGDVNVNWYDPAPRPTLYVPDSQAPARTMSIVIRTRVAPLSVAQEVRRALTALDPLQPIGGLEPLTTSIADSLSPVRVIDRLLAAGAGIACLLEAIGVFGILAQAVAQRLGEFGVRFALGATPQAIGRMVLCDALATGGLGLAGGVAAAGALARVVGAALIGLTSFDAPLVVAVGAGTMALVVGAALLPAVRASRVSVGTLLRA
jgi:putative ABC transport system permease protein